MKCSEFVLISMQREVICGVLKLLLAKNIKFLLKAPCRRCFVHLFSPFHSGNDNLAKMGFYWHGYFPLFAN